MAINQGKITAQRVSLIPMKLTITCFMAAIKDYKECVDHRNVFSQRHNLLEKRVRRLGTWLPVEQIHRVPHPLHNGFCTMSCWKFSMVGILGNRVLES